MGSSATRTPPAGPLVRLLALALAGFAGGFAVAGGCASSDQVLKAEAELSTIQTKPRAKAECKPGVVEPCYSGPDATSGRGVCRDGTRTCDDTGAWSKCNGDALPKRELCNRIDDDCDGIMDNGFEREGAICFRGKGACKSRGAWACSKDGANAECSAPIVKPQDEICDGVDNDCDDQVDEGDVPGTGVACSTGLAGVCNAGTKRCNVGTIRCMQNVQAGMEICNKLDDNCNNEVDEDCVKPEEARKMMQEQAAAAGGAR